MTLRFDIRLPLGDAIVPLFTLEAGRRILETKPMGSALRIPATSFLVATLFALAACGSDGGEAPNGDNQNECEPATCESLGVECGDHSDGCGDTAVCGSCGEGLACSGGQCIDDTPAVLPEVSIDDAPDALTNDTEATFEFSCDLTECDFECALDGDAESCSSPHTYSELPDGDHHFEVRATSDEGHTGDWAEYFWTVDTAAPQIVGLVGPPDPSGLNSPSFDFECSKQECDFHCAFNGEEQEDFEACQPGVSYAGVTSGDHTFEVFATDIAGNEGDVATWQWTMDPDVPDVIDLEGPADPTTETSATFTFDCSEPDCDFECALNSADFEACESGVTYEELDDADHTFEVRPTDAENNVGGIVTWSWTVNTSPPQVEFDAVPPGETDQSDAAFEFSCVDGECVEFECSFDGADFETCTSPYTVTDLEEGNYVFTVRAIGATGLTAEISHHWVVNRFGWNDVSPGDRHTCAITNDDALYCWGINDNGQLGDGTETNRAAPTQIGSNQDWIAVSAGARHTCGIRSDHSLWCWGDRTDGQVGDGSTAGNRHVPIAVAPQAHWTDVSAGISHTCALRTNGSIWCWGDNLAGQLGDSTNEPSSTPLRAGSDAGWADVAASGDAHTCARRHDGTIWCWGSNDRGALGNDSQDGSSEPVQVGDHDGWTSIAAGKHHNCALRDDGQIWCWGDNSSAQLGDFSGATSQTPVRVGDDQGWHQLSNGNAHNCALRDGSAAYCWGDNQYGTLGDGEEQDSDVPVAVQGPSNWNTLQAGGRITCGIRDDQTLWCWGFEDDDALTTNPDFANPDPTEIPPP